MKARRGPRVGVHFIKRDLVVKVLRIQASFVVNRPSICILQQPSPQITFCRVKKIGFLKKSGKDDLNDILCFGYIMKHTECHTHDQPIVAVEDHGHGLVIAGH